ncbi:alpha/beta hydrolase [Hyphomicrobium sp. 2TAF46]|uniref:alpha/beta hydrolase n=1 Tax=Hyphomicrobium sp. 2TAF46 TaxID=3233019 RepID=UPI003F91E138
MTGRTVPTTLSLSTMAAIGDHSRMSDHGTKSARIRFPVGYHSLHPDVSMNFQMNRWYSWVGEPDMLQEMRVAAPRISNYADWTREFVALAKLAWQRGHILRAGFYWRSAEFFMRPNDPERKTAREKFLEATRSVYRLELGKRHAVPYADGNIEGILPAYRFTPAHSKATIVFFGGFDSYVEELTAAFIYLRDAGYEVIAFEGPGQGGALNDSGLHMTAEWHKPVKAILDYFKLDRVTLIGLSMGGCLAVRAAAFEERIERVVAYDIYPDALDVNLRQVTLLRRRLLKVLLVLRAATIVNIIANRIAKTSPVAEWGIETGMHVNGASSPYAFFRKTEQFITADVSALIKQDVLLLAGSEDHLVPLEHFYSQTKSLSNASSVTARVFTPSESAENHCQVGNYGLALRTIVAWLDVMLLENVNRHHNIPALAPELATGTAAT